MKPNRRILYTLLLAVASGLVACDGSDGVGDLTGPEAPQYSANNGNAFGHSKKQVEVLRRSNALSGDVTYVTSTPVTVHGATLNFGGHTLVVPKNAVKHKTYFSATIRAGDEIRLDMRAWDERGNEVTTFRKPVQLTIDFSDALIDDSELKDVAVFYLNPNGEKEKMPSVLNAEARSVTGYLNHFSDYIPGTLRNDPPPPPVWP